ncbi:MAG: hypothetical protein FWG20_02115, partial [Candidatus Cloacimonetes bacterium]|nr:hypothetical protein [Candidatus Cloacimonadota bacterium]
MNKDKVAYQRKHKPILTFLNIYLVRKIILYIVTVTPFIIGIIGYYRIYQPKNGYTFIDACYSALRLYSMNMDIKMNQVNIWIEIARFGAFLVVTMIIFKLLHLIGKEFIFIFVGLRKDSCAVYGDSAYNDHLVKDLGYKAIAHKTPIVKNAQNHIINFGNDFDNLLFYENNKRFFDRKNVYIHMDILEREHLEKNNVTLFNTSENVARLFWQKHLITQNKTICIIGFEALGQYILHFGLLFNIFSTEQKVVYHIWGDFEKYESLHTELGKIKETDDIIFHSYSWW